MIDISTGLATGRIKVTACLTNLINAGKLMRKDASETHARQVY